MKFRSLIFLFTFFTLFSCQKQQSQNVAIVDAPTFAKTIETTPQAQILDVRTPEEFETEHINDAININWNGNSFVSEAEKLDKTKPVFVYCKSGGRSQKAAEKLKELGFTDIYELDGGFMQWSLEGFKSNKN
ncbi:rhodanese-like domain-containing protein [Flavobacterium sp. NG2]|uniref:rhodanese-like domain-containing protein n=1 Tax=Flavobacterium sp. NG2 TaxID=3097547 RepID=UPI002A7F91C3|nr:rhodanese-like domain-containing protein [Flavobacterium sp. NG2]WPR72961.1 rhodanese-like domain-containing protein [Flavobacterium sp. NG2]